MMSLMRLKNTQFQSAFDNGVVVGFVSTQPTTSSFSVSISSNIWTFKFLPPTFYLYNYLKSIGLQSLNTFINSNHGKSLRWLECRILPGISGSSCRSAILLCPPLMAPVPRLNDTMHLRLGICLHFAVSTSGTGCWCGAWLCRGGFDRE